MNSRLWLQLLARRPVGRRSPQEGGFALALAVFVAFTVMVGWVALANRSSSSRLGAALQDENREARIAAESGLAIVIDELNRPANRMILAKGQVIGSARNPALTAWNQPVANGSPLINPCANTELVDIANEVRPTALATTIGRSGVEGNVYIPLQDGSTNDRVSRRFRVVRYQLKNADRAPNRAYQDYDPSQVNLSPPDRDNHPKRGVGYVEVTVEGQVLRGGKPVATSQVTQEFQVVPKCCNRSFRGPGDRSRASEKTGDGYLPGLYGDDNRYCYENFPQMVLGTGNGPDRNDGGLFLINSTPNLRNQNDPTQKPIRVLCYTNQASCGGQSLIDGVPVMRSDVKPPNVPVIGPNGIPCDVDDIQCQKDGVAAAQTFSSRPIELLNRTLPCAQGETDCVLNGSKENSATDKFAKDYIRVNGKNLEICNKTYENPDVEGRNRDYLATNNGFDKNPTIVPGSCETLYDDNNREASSNVCARQDNDGFVSYHCRISNIFVNDFDGRTEASALANNTLFIDTTGNPETINPRINLHVNEDWAKTRLVTTYCNDPARRKEFLRDCVIANTMGSPGTGLSHNNFRSIYTVGGYNDGQIQHVNCGNSATDPNKACLTPAKPEESTRAAIVSACKRHYNASSGKVEDLCERDKRANTVSAEVGDDGYMRGMFLYTPFSTITVYGDPTVDTGWDSQDLDQGRPQIAAAVWAHRLRFVSRTTELYVPGVNAEFFGMETSRDDRYTPPRQFDFVARGITGRSLFSIPKLP